MVSAVVELVPVYLRGAERLARVPGFNKYERVQGCRQSGDGGHRQERAGKFTFYLIHGVFVSVELENGKPA